VNRNPRSDRILLIRLSAIGDVVHALHALASLREARPDAFVGFLVEDRAAGLVTGHPDLDRVHVYRRRRWQRGILARPFETISEVRRFLAEIRSCRYGSSVDLQGNLKGGVLAALSGAPRRIGLARSLGKEGNHLFQTERVDLLSGPVHRIDRALALVSPLGADGRRGTPRIAVAPAEEEEMDRFLEAANLAGKGFAVLHPATSGFGRHKRWAPERFGALAALLLAEHGLPSLATWGPGEEELAEEVVAASGGAARPGPRTPSLAALAHLARRSRLFVAADTGALHLAAMLGVPTVGLFGPKDPAVYGPRGPRTEIVFKGVDCSPCPNRSCPDPVCMTSITPGDVLAAARLLLGEDGGTPPPGTERNDG
jgi:ADP-heptose:LPS heptosyltransferase